MRYHDYMSQFTVIDETKSLLFSRMQQRAKQIKAACGELEPSAVTSAVPQKATPIITSVAPQIPFAQPTAKQKTKNAIKLHPKRWIAIGVSIAMVLAAIPTVYFTAFNGKNRLNSVKLEYMDNMMVETDGVTAYSIKKETESATPMNLQTSEGKAPAISLLSASVVKSESGTQPYAKKEKSHNYLYSTSASYEFGNVEYDENGITKVTFMKNKEVTEDVYDNNGNLIDSDRKITQEELDAEINKIYTTKEYTFIQFVVPVEKSGWYEYKTADGETGREYVYLRPESMIYDEYGVADFDKAVRPDRSTLNSWSEAEMAAISYYSSALSASFVIDNATGYIYKIENIQIDGFQNGLVKSYGPDEGHGKYADYWNPQHITYYSISTDENHNLIFTDVLPNKDIEVNNVLLDAYGWVYVLNNRVDEIDRERKIIYTTDEWKYVFDANRYVYVRGKFTATAHIDPSERANEAEIEEYPDTFNCLDKKIVNGEEVAFEAGGTIRDLYLLFRTDFSSEYDRTCELFGMYGNIAVLRENVVLGLGINRYYMAHNQENVDYGIMLYFEASSVHWLDNNFDTLIQFENGRLSYVQVDLNECLTKAVRLRKGDFINLSDYTLVEAEDYYLSVGNDQYKVNDVYYHAALNETKYYHIVKTTTGVELEELTSKSYADNVFIFQPINK